MDQRVMAYIEDIESGRLPGNGDHLAYCAYVRRCFETEEIYTDSEQLSNYLKLEKYFSFQLFPWEIHLLGLWLCTYWKGPVRVPRWDTLFSLLGRGGGKDGFIAFCSMALVSPYNPVQEYDVDICANNEEQAVRPVEDLVNALENPKWEQKLKNFFYHTKELVRGRSNRGRVRGHTNNPGGRDGLRSGCVILNEVHAYQNYDNINVFKTGLGKKAEPRTGIFSSNGNVSDGPLDDYIGRGERILREGEPDNGFLPFLNRLLDIRDIHDRDKWAQANPSLPYLPNLLREIEKQYRDWLEHPEENGEFVTKRFGIRSGQKEIMVTSYEKIKATNKPLPDLTGQRCTVGLDYAELSDWAAVNIHFRKGESRYDINHAWICKESRTLHRVKAPWQKWVEEGKCTLVEDVSINPKLLAAYIRRVQQEYMPVAYAMDNFRWTLVSEAMREIGVDARDKELVKLIRPSDIMQVDPVIQELFDRELMHWGDTPHLRWAANNTKRVRSSKKQGVDTGNYIYAKIEGKSRKTDPFMALVASMVVEPALGDGQPLELPPVPAFGF